MGDVVKLGLGALALTFTLFFLLGLLPMEFSTLPLATWNSYLSQAHVFLAQAFAFASPVIDFQFLLNILKTSFFLILAGLILKLLVFVYNLLGIGAGT